MSALGPQHQTPRTTHSTPTMPTVAVELKCAEPDLEVVVGTQVQEVFHYHSVILASYSEYVDTMLASPMREQSEMKITFPDIEPEVWVKLIKFLEPGGSRATDLDIVVSDLLPICDRYGFRSGINLIDDIISTLLSSYNTGNATFGFDANFMNTVAAAAVESKRFNLKRSALEATKFATQTFKNPTRQDFNYQLLLPLVENDEATLKHAVSTILGREEMSIEEMRNVISDESFNSAFSLRLRLIQDEEKNMFKLSVDRVKVIGAGVAEINGVFNRDYRDIGPAVMMSGFSMSGIMLNGGEMSEALLQAKDPFGKVWEIAVVTVENPEGQNVRSSVLYRWEKEYSSLVPPRHGWSAIDGALPVPSLDFQFSR